MTIQVDCACGEQLHVGNETAGREVECPGCGLLVEVPQASAAGGFKPALPAAAGGLKPASQPRASARGKYKSLRKTTQPAESNPSEAEARATSASKLSMVLAAIALLTAILALLRTAATGPLGAGLSRYDLSTPEAALQTGLQTIANGDIQARLELIQLHNQKIAEEKLGSLTIHKSTEIAGQSFVFFSFSELGVQKYDVKMFEKDAGSEAWIERALTAADEMRLPDSVISEIQQWKSRTETQTENKKEEASEPNRPTSADDTSTKSTPLGQTGPAGPASRLRRLPVPPTDAETPEQNAENALPSTGTPTAGSAPFSTSSGGKR
jgi:hypothetical protein